MKITVDGEEFYVWAAADSDRLEILAIDVSPGRSGLDVQLFLKNVLERRLGRPLVRADRDPWYDWPLELPNREYERDT